MTTARTVMVATAAATAVNVAFWLIPTGRLRRRFTLSRSPPPTPAPLSVVLAARDEAGALPHSLPGILAQDHPSLDVVVCDDDSADGTADLLAAFRQNHPRRLRVVSAGPKTSPGKKRALAAAIAHARHDWLLLTDADCVPASDRWAGTMRAAADPHDELVLGYSPYRQLPSGGWLNRWIRFEAFYTAVQYLSAALAGRPYMGVGRNLAYARRLYERAGGFASHAHLAGGDDDLLVNAAARAGATAVCVDPAAWTYSQPHVTWRAYARQKRRHLAVATAYRLADRAWLGLLAVSHVGHYAGGAALAAMGHPRWALTLYSVRAVAVWPRIARLQRAMGVGDLVRYVPLADVATACYYVVGALAFAPGQRVKSRW